MGHSAPDTQSLRKAEAHTAWSGDDHAPANPRRSHGGQASLGLFGIPGAGHGLTGLANAARQRIATQAVATAAQTAPPVAARAEDRAVVATATACKPWTSRIKGALNPGDRDGLSPAHYGETVPAPAPAPSPTPTPARVHPAHDLFEHDLFDLAPQASQPFSAPPAPAAMQPSVSATVHLRRDKFQAFVRLSDREQRPVEDVLTEWMSECAALIGRDELFEGSAIQTTPAMRATARASDAREAYRTDTEDKADFLFRTSGNEEAEITLAIED